MFKHVLIATDGSELAAKAVTTGFGLAKALGANVTVVTVTEPRTNLMPDKAATSLPVNDLEADVAAAAKTFLSDAYAEATRLGITCDTVHVPNDFPAEAIIRAAKEKGCDAIVMASHGRRGLARLLLGGETLRVVTNSEIPVVVCR